MTKSSLSATRISGLPERKDLTWIVPSTSDTRRFPVLLKVTFSRSMMSTKISSRFFPVRSVATTERVMAEPGMRLAAGHEHRPWPGEACEGHAGVEGADSLKTKALSASVDVHWGTRSRTSRRGARRRARSCGAEIPPFRTPR